MPDFIYAGAPKAGSSWLFEALKEHPDIYVPPAKDLQFFDKYFDKGYIWYQRHFERAGGLTCGELSHDYFTEEFIAERIKKLLPDVKIIFCLRDPADLTLSAWRYARNHSKEFDTTFKEYSQKPIAQKQIDYLRNLAFFYDRFPRNKIHVFFFDEIKHNPASAIQEIYKFLCVDSSFNPSKLLEKVNSAKQSRLAILTNTAYKVAQLLRKLGFVNLLGSLKSNHFIEKMLYEKSISSDLSELSKDDRKVYESISRKAQQENRELESLIKKQIPPNWYKKAVDI